MLPNELFVKIQLAVKSLKTAGKHLSEMGTEIDKVAEISSAAPLHEKFEEVEHLKIDIEAQLLERVFFTRLKSNRLNDIILSNISHFVLYRMLCYKKQQKNGNNVKENFVKRKVGWRKLNSL